MRGPTRSRIRCTGPDPAAREDASPRNRRSSRICGSTRRQKKTAGFYTSVFENSRIINVTRYTEAGPRPAGMVTTVEFEGDGQRFVGINDGPEFTFDEAISFQISCETQSEFDSD